MNRVLYVCSFAHRGGHQLRTAIYETRALANAGVQVTLLTFRGILYGSEVSVPQLTVRPYLKLLLPLYHLASQLQKGKFTQPYSKLMEYFLTVYVAHRLYRKLQFDVIQLRDAEPIPFLSHLFTIMKKDYKWVISLDGENLIRYPPLFQILTKNPRRFPRVIFEQLVNSNIWAPIYRISLTKNKVVYLAESKVIEQGYEKYGNGVLEGKIIYLPIGVDRFEETISKQEAREHLGLPEDKVIFLSFGVTHVGKDYDTVFRAIKDIAHVVLVCAGMNLPDTPDLVSLSYIYGIENRTIVRSCFIAEEDKPYYFIAADAVILSYTRDFSGSVTTFWDACRFSIPVIANDNEQIAEFITNYRTGVLFKTQDVSSLKQAITAFLALDSEKTRLLRDNCERFCNEFSLKRWAERCIDIYKTM